LISLKKGKIEEINPSTRRKGEKWKKKGAKRKFPVLQRLGRLTYFKKKGASTPQVEKRVGTILFEGVI